MRWVNPADIRNEGYETGSDLDRRYYTNEALQGTVLRLSRRLMDAADALELAEAVAHRAWHLLEDSGESELGDNGNPLHVYLHVDHERASQALDALEVSGWMPVCAASSVGDTDDQ